MPSTQTLAQLSDNFVYSAIAVYVLAMVAYAALSARRTSRRTASRPDLVLAGSAAADDAVGEFAEPGDRGAPGDARSDRDASGRDASGRDEQLAAIGAALTMLGFVLHLASVVTRGLAAQRAPWGNMYEFTLVGALAVTATYLVFLRKEPVRVFGVWITGIVVLGLGLGVTVLATPVGALVPVLNTYWLVIHVAAAIVSGGMFTLGAVAVLLYRVRLRAEDPRPGARTGPVTRYGAHLPSAATLQRVSHTTHLFAFPIWTFAVIAGAIWAENSWGRYWGWDPKETWAFITWVLYAAYLHAEATPGWRGRKATWFALGGFLAFVFNFFGVNMWIPGLHSYAGL